MKAKDSENLNKIIQAINEVMPNLDISTNEDEEGITVQFEIPRAGVVGRPRNKPQLPLETVGGQG